MELLQSNPKMEKTKEENAIVLDFLPNGYPFDERPSYMKTPIAQVIGKEHFVLSLEFPFRSTCIIATIILSAEATKSIAPPIPLINY